MKQAIRYLFICIGVAFAASGRVDAQNSSPVFDFHFVGENGTAGWNPTAGTTLSQKGDFASISGDGWDTKIDRVIHLPAGTYVAYGEASGQTEIKIVGLDWKKEFFIFNLISDKDVWKTTPGGWRVDYRDFEVPDGDYYLVVQVKAEKGEARIRSLKIESAPPKQPEPGVSTPAHLSAVSATLPTARGFMAGYLNDQTFSDMGKWGANLTRLNVWPANGWPKMTEGRFWEDQMPLILDYLEKEVAAAKKANIKVAVVCMFPPPVDGKLLDHGTSEFWSNPATEKTMVRFWTLIAQRLMPYRSAIYGYDLFNEPLDESQLPYEPREWRKIAIHITQNIRKFDKKTWMIYEPGPGGLVRGFEGLVPLPDDRVIYSPHFYYPFEFCAQGVHSIEGTDLPKLMKELNVHYPSQIKDTLWNKAQLEQVLDPVVKFQEKWKVPIYIGEFSVIRWAPKQDAVQWLQDCVDIFESHGWSWSYHAFREANCWSLEYDENYWIPGTPAPLPVSYETDRAKVIKDALKKNSTSAH